jgi:outer membrane protein OmpA-like peptidoglycan-associated protein
MRRAAPIPLACALAGLLGTAGCATARPVQATAPSGSATAILRGAELARVRCLVVSPFENASSSPRAAEVATEAFLASAAAVGTKVLPIDELRALFQETTFELPAGVSPGMAVELAQLVGAEAVAWGTVEGDDRTEPGLVVSVRVALSPRRDLLYATSFAVADRPGERTEAALKRSFGDATAELFLRLGSARGGSCFERRRLEALRAMALAEGGPKAAPAPPPAPTPVAVAAPPPPAAAPAPAPAPPQPPRAPLNPRQREWAQRLAEGDPFLVADVAWAGRSAILLREGGLADLAAALGANPELKVRLDGHVDATQDPAADTRLSVEMARAAAERLAQLGVAADRIQPAGRGSASPRLPNFTARGRAANRRIEAVGIR